MKKYLALIFTFVAFSHSLFAEEASVPQESPTTLLDIIMDGGFLSALIWLMLFSVSLAALLIAIHCFHLLKKSRFFVEKETELISLLIKENKLKSAMTQNDSGKSTFAMAMGSIFRNIRKGEQKAGESASQVLEEHAASLNRHISTLQMCGNIAPMLGLLGTVTGMVSAFMGLGTAVGAEKASALAVSISQALYTTAAGLLIAVPALVLAHLARNRLESLISQTARSIEDAAFPIWNRPAKSTAKTIS